MPNIPARRILTMIALAALVGFGFASIPGPARAAAGPVAAPHGLALTDVGYRDVDWPRRDPVVERRGVPS